VKVNISIDDISPHPRSSVKVLERCYELLDVFPDIKFTLFVPMAYTRYQEKSYPLDEFSDFCDILKSLSSDVFELGWHGYYHGLLDRSNNDEFRYLDYDEADIVLNKMFSMAKRANVYDLFSFVLRPSAFYMSSSSIKACKDNGIKVLALSQDKVHKDSYCGSDEDFDKVVYFDSNPPFKSLVVKDGLEVVYHACEWDKNYLSAEKTKELIEFLKGSGDIEFVLMEDM